jgi:hypothetical protein
MLEIIIHISIMVAVLIGSAGIIQYVLTHIGYKKPSF